MSDFNEEDPTPEEEPVPVPEGASEENAAGDNNGGNDTYHITGTLTNKEGELHEIDVTKSSKGI